MVAQNTAYLHNIHKKEWNNDSSYNMGELWTNLSEQSQIQKAASCVTSFISNIHKGEIHRDKRDGLLSPSGPREDGGISTYGDGVSLGSNENVLECDSRND